MLGLIGAGLGLASDLISGNSARKRRNRLIRNMPKYKIAKEAEENVSIAKARAFGRDRAVQNAEENISKDSATAVSEAKNISSNTSDLLSTISAINANSGNARRQLAQDASTIQQQNVGALMAANQGMIDERDKEFMQNKQAKWDAKMRALEAQRASQQNLFGNLFNAGVSVFNANPGLGSNLFGSKSGS